MNWRKSNYKFHIHFIFHNFLRSLNVSVTILLFYDSQWKLLLLFFEFVICARVFVSVIV